MQVEHLIKHFGSTIGLPDLALNNNGICRVKVDNKLAINFEQTVKQDVLFVYAQVCKIRHEYEFHLFKVFLEANLFGRGTGTAAFAFDQNTHVVLLQLQIDCNKVTEEEFIAQLQDFINRLEFWSQQVREARLQQEKRPAVQDDLSGEPELIRV